MRTCKKCNESKDDTEFKWMTGDGCGAGYFNGSCKVCVREYQKTTPSNAIHQHPDQLRKRWLKAKYNITPQEYDLLFESQGGVCKICGTADTGTCRFLSVDHCHTTNKVRGLLCQSCNKGLGLFRDNVVLLQQAADYLNKA